MFYTIKNDVLSLTVSTLGAEAISLKYKGEEKIWQNPTGEWAGHAYVLFPTCGNFGIKVDGKHYPIRFHGIARYAQFTLVDQTETSLTFAISTSEETKKVYPYDFTFKVTYTLDGNKYNIDYTVINHDTKPMYFACGGHESFNLEKDVDAYKLVFEKTERLMPEVERGREVCEYTCIDCGTAKEFPLPVECMKNDETLIFKNVQSQTVTLCEKTGEALAKITYAKQFAHLLLWRSKQAKYICIEPWSNLPESDETKELDLSQKPGAIKLDGKQTLVLNRSITYLK